MKAATAKPAGIKFKLSLESGKQYLAVAGAVGGRCLLKSCIS
jgi:hypothetical protein